MASLLDKFHQLTDALRSHEAEASALEPLATALGKALATEVTVVDLSGTALFGHLPANVLPGSTGHVSRRSAQALAEVIGTEMPLFAGRERVGTLLLARQDSDLSDYEWCLVEYGATVLGMLVHAAIADREAESSRQSTAVKIAMDALSYSELVAAQRLFSDLNGDQGLIVTSHVADQMGITRSVIVNALRKLESAGVIETRSLGMKGTHIRVLNSLLRDAFAKLRI